MDENPFSSSKMGPFVDEILRELLLTKPKIIAKFASCRGVLNTP